MALGRGARNRDSMVAERYTRRKCRRRRVARGVRPAMMLRELLRNLMAVALDGTQCSRNWLPEQCQSYDDRDDQATPHGPLAELQ